MPSPALLAIGSAFFASLANILARSLLKDSRARDMLSVNFLTMAATLLLLSPLFYSFSATLLSVGILLLVALIDSFANYFYFKTFERTEASVATPILSLAPAFTFFAGFVVLREEATLSTYLAAFSILFLVLIFSVDTKDTSRFMKATLVPALLSSFLFGLSAIPTKYLLTTLHALNAPTLYMFRAGLIGLFGALFFRFSIGHLNPGQYRTIFMRSLLVIAQWILLYYALSSGHAGVTMTLGNITPVFTFLLGMVFLRERPMWKKSITAVLILILSFFIR